MVSFSASVHAASEAAVLFLLISPSPLANGMGETYGNIASTDPMASIFNPAYLGIFSKSQNFGLSYSKANWLPKVTNDLYHKSFSLNFGYTFKNVPVTLGIGYHHVYFDLGKQVLMNEFGDAIETFESHEKADVISFSALWDYYILASVGFSYKFIESNLASFREDSGMGDGKASAKAYDFGIALKFPVFDILAKKTNRQIYALPHVAPFLEPGLSYSVTNIGDEITYTDETQADPLPRTVFTGINIAAGLKYENTNHPFNILSFRWAQEANDLLVERAGENIKYSSGFKDIDFVENVLLGKSNAKIITNNGWELGFAEIFYLRKGDYQDFEGKVKFDTDGWGINFMQPIRLLLDFTNFKIENGIFRALVDNLDVEFHRSKFQAEKEHPLDNIEFNGLSLKLKNIFSW
jgi:hypothetical protein